MCFASAPSGPKRTRFWFCSALNSHWYFCEERDLPQNVAQRSSIQRGWWSLLLTRLRGQRGSGRRCPGSSPALQTYHVAWSQQSSASGPQVCAIRRRGLARASITLPLQMWSTEGFTWVQKLRSCSRPMDAESASDHPSCVCTVQSKKHKSKKLPGSGLWPPPGQLIAWT